MLTGLIGCARQKAVEILKTHGLTPFRKVLPPTVFQDALRVPRPASTVLTPEVVFWLMATVALSAGGSMAAAVPMLWASLRASWPHLDLKPVTEEAFCVARNALPMRFFRRVFAAVLSGFQKQFGSRHQWRGLRLMGIDGMDFDLPNSPRLRAAFPPPTNQHGARKRPQARLVGLVGLLDGLCYDFRLVALNCSEQRCARSLFRCLSQGDLLLQDCNFVNHEMMARVSARNADFLGRVQSNRFHKVDHIPTPSGRSQEWYADLPVPVSVRKQVPSAPSVIRVRIVQYQIRGFRPARLITSLLDVEKYPYEEVVAVYHERWRQETQHREWKYTLTISNLRSHKPQGIRKEVLTQLTLNNVIRWIMAEAGGTEHRPVDLKFLEAKRLTLAAVPAMVVARTEQLPYLYRQLLAAISGEVILVRPGRSYPRTWDTRGRPKGHGKSAAPARLAVSTENLDASI